jgi:hypothetical protein
MSGSQEAQMTLSANGDAIVHELPAQSPNCGKLNGRIISIAADLVATNPSCANPRLPQYVISL